MNIINSLNNIFLGIPRLSDIHKLQFRGFNSLFRGSQVESRWFITQHDSPPTENETRSKVNHMGKIFFVKW